MQRNLNLILSLLWLLLLLDIALKISGACIVIIICLSNFLTHLFVFSYSCSFSSSFSLLWCVMFGRIKYHQGSMLNLFLVTANVMLLVHLLLMAFQFLSVDEFILQNSSLTHFIWCLFLFLCSNGSWRSTWNIEFKSDFQALEIRGKMQVLSVT